MFVQSPGIRSKVAIQINSDLDSILIITYFLKKQYLRNVWNLIKINLTKEQTVILGGSQVFGVGSTKDMGTISSNLTTLSDEFCFNLGGRAFNGFQ